MTLSHLLDVLIGLEVALVVLTVALCRAAAKRPPFGPPVAVVEPAAVLLDGNLTTS